MSTETPKEVTDNTGRIPIHMNPDGGFTLGSGENAATFEDPTQAVEADRSILDLFRSNNETIVVDKVIEVQGQPRTVHVKKLSPRAIDAYNSKKLRMGRNGRIVEGPDGEELLGTVWRIVDCIVHNVAPEGEPPRWESLLTYEDLMGKPEVKVKGKVIEPAIPGLVDNADDETQSFLFWLDYVACEVNPSVDPLKLAAVYAQMA